MQSDLSTAPVARLIFRYYVPALTSMLAVTLHHVINSVILARYAGKEAVGAVGLFGPVMMLMIGFVLPVAIGGGIIISRSLGAGNTGRAKEIFSFSTTMVFISSSSIALLAPFITTPIVTFLTGTTTGSLFDETHDYMFWGFLWTPPFLVRTIWGSFVTNDGAPRTSRNASIIGVVANIILDFIFIVWLKLGAGGASLATGIAIIISTGYLSLHFFKGNGSLRAGDLRFSLSIDNGWELLKYGIPSFASELSLSLGLIFINKSATAYGTDVVSAFGIINQISFVFLRMFTACMLSVLPIFSFNIGARQPARVLSALWYGITFSTILGLVITSISWMFPSKILGLFADASDVAYMKIASSAFQLYSLLYLAAGSNYVISAYLQSIGKTTITTAFNLTKGGVLAAILLLVLPLYFDGAAAVWLSRSMAEVVALGAIVIVIIAGRKTLLHADSILSKNR